MYRGGFLPHEGVCGQVRNFVLLNGLEAKDHIRISRLRKWPDDRRGNCRDDMAKLVHTAHLKESERREGRVLRNVPC